MPRIYWLPALAAVGLAVLAVLGWRLYEWHQGRERAYQAAHQQYEDAKRRLPPGIAIDDERSVPDPKSYREEWRDERDLEAQRDMAEWAFLMVLVSAAGVGVTAIGVVYIAMTLREARATTKAALAAAEASQDGADAARKSVAIADDTAKRQLRAYLFVENVRYTYNVDRLGNFTGWSITPIIRNAGATPALEVRLWVARRIFVPKKADSFKLTGDAVEKPGFVSAIGPHSDVPLEALPFKVETLERAQRKEAELVVWGRIDYRDSFEDTPGRHVEFAFDVLVTGDIHKDDAAKPPISTRNRTDHTSYS